MLLDNLHLKINEDGSIAYSSREKVLDIEVPLDFFKDYISDFWVFNGTNLELVPDADILRDAHNAERQKQKDQLALDIKKQNKINLLNKKTKSDILAIADESKQRNYLAKYNELIEKKIDSTITADELIIMSDIKAIWIQIETLRNNGNALEAQIQACTTQEELDSIII